MVGATVLVPYLRETKSGTNFLLSSSKTKCKEKFFDLGQLKNTKAQNNFSLARGVSVLFIEKEKSYMISTPPKSGIFPL